MRYPDFFDQAPMVTVRDPLADFLGAAENGVMEYRYADAVKLAGHSCPTVASAFLTARAALRELYGEELPVRGEVRVEFREDKTAGVTGVIANVASLLTGATQDTGFKGIGGRFDRRNLLFFNAAIRGETRYTRLDTGAAVEVSARTDRVPGDPRMRELLPRCLEGTASAEEADAFRQMWQSRVRSLLLQYCDDPQVVIVERC